MLCAIIRPLLEIALDLRHLIGDEGEADHRLAASLSKGIEPSHFHLDGFQPFSRGRIERRAGLAERCVSRPRATANRHDSRALEFLRYRGEQMRIANDVARRRKIGVARAFTTQRVVNENRSRERHSGIKLASRSDTDQQSAARGEELLGHQDRKRGADGAAEDPHPDAVHLGL